MGILPDTEGYGSHEAEVEVIQGGTYFTCRNTEEVRWKAPSEDEKENVWKAVETVVVGFKAVTIISPEEANTTRHQKQRRVISSMLVLRWKETDSGHIAKVRWCVHGFKDPGIHEIERSCPSPEVASI